MLELLALFEPEALHNLRHSISCAEIAHEIIFEADIKSRSARIALTRAASAKLSIYPPRFVSLRSKNKQSTILRYARTELNVGAAAGHVRRDRYRSGLARAHYDLGFLHVKLRVQHVVRNFFALQHPA